MNADQPDREDHRRTVTKRTSMPEVYMPAMPPLELMAAIDRWAARRRRRRALRQLLELDDHLLCDLGLTREHLAEAIRRRGPVGAPERCGP